MPAITHEPASLTQEPDEYLTTEQLEALEALLHPMELVEDETGQILLHIPPRAALTLPQIGLLAGLQKTRVFQLEKAALQKLATRFGSNPEGWLPESQSAYRPTYREQA